VGRPIARYTASRRYVFLAISTLIAALLTGSIALRWPQAWVAVALFALIAAGVSLLAFRPAIEIHEAYLAVGRRAIGWSEIRRIDHTGWTAPLAVHVTLADRSRVLIVHAGDLDSSSGLLRHLRRYSREALLDGIPYRQFWGEAPTSKQLPPPRYPLLRPEDEEEVERLFQRLKSVGRLDARSSNECPDEK
jgi:hypothetical protein